VNSSRAFALFIVVGASACSRGETPAATDPKAAPAPGTPGTPPTPAGPADAPKPATDTKKADEPPKASASEIAAQRKRMLVALNEGRALVKKGEHAAGIAKYREVLAIDGSDPAALAELGWAAFLANDLELAASATEHALRFSRAANQRGMLLYNLGRVFEARGENEGARDLYVRSLAARPNATVLARLEALEAIVKSKLAPAGPRSLSVLAKKLPTLQAVCDHLVADVCADHRMFEDETCGCEPKLEAESGGGTWGLVSLLTNQAGGSEALFPVSQEADGWTVLDVAAETFNPGAFGIWEELEPPKAEMIDVLPGGGEEFLLTFSKGRSDRDMGINEIESESWGTRVLCTRDLGTTACTRPLVETYEYGREVEFEDEEVEGSDPIEHTSGLPLDSHYRTSLSFSAGHVEVGPIEATKDLAGPDTDVTGPLRLPAGRHDLRVMLLPVP
jgi:hypothetical protein